MAAIAYYLLQSAIVALEGPGSTLARAVGSDWKGKTSPVLYVLAIGLAFVHPWLSYAIYVPERDALADSGQADRAAARFAGRGSTFSRRPGADLRVEPHQPRSDEEQHILGDDGSASLIDARSAGMH